MEGELEYDSTESFENAVAFLEDHGYADAVEIDRGSNVIRIEYGTYRNLGRNLDRLVEEASAGTVIGFSNDVSWHGFVETAGGKSEEINLNKFAEEHGFEEPPNTDNPDEYTDWQGDVEELFLEEYGV